MGEGTGTFPRGSQKPGQESKLSGPPRSKELARNREIEKDRKNREEERHGDSSSDGAKCFNQHVVVLYTVLQGSYSQQRQRLKFQIYKT